MPKGDHLVSTKERQKRLLSIPEGGAYLGRTTWAVREMIWAGKLPIVRDGRRILLDIDDLDKWINQNKIIY